MSEDTHCPLCSADLDGGPIPEAIRHHYSPPYRWGRQIGIYSRDEDRTVAWQCPDCRGTWPRDKPQAESVADVR